MSSLRGRQNLGREGVGTEYSQGNGHYCSRAFALGGLTRTWRGVSSSERLLKARVALRVSRRPHQLREALKLTPHLPLTGKEDEREIAVTLSLQAEAS
eukprot:5271126-Pleurochrysis_carterae.AAC.1